MAEQNLEGLFSTCMQGLRDMVDVNTIVGEPIETKDGTTVIPISKVAFGFGVGGGDMASAGAEQEKPSTFAGGSGGGVTIQPIGFLVVGNGDVKMVNVDASTPLDAVIENIPAVVESISSIFKKK